MSMTQDPPIDLARNRVIGILCIVGAMVLFSINDVTIKFLSGDYALHQVILIRTLVAMTLLLAVIVPLQGGYGALTTKRLPMHLLRGFFVVIANMMFFVALASLPLAETVAISFVSPLLITIFSVLILRETVGPRRWAAIAVGFLGVLVVLRPGTDAFQPAALLPLVGAFAYAMLNIMTRKMGGTERATTLAFYIQLTFITVSGSMGLAFGDGRLAGTGDASLDFLLRAWIWPHSGDWPVLVLLGLVSGLGSVLISQAYRLCEAALIAPFEYTAMPLAVIFGMTVFGDWPDLISWVGITLIVAGGLYMIWRETRSRKMPGIPRARR